MYMAYSGYVFKALSEMWLYSSWVFSLREYLQQLIIGEKIETRKGTSLCLQIVTQSLLNLKRERESDIGQDKRESDTGQDE